MSGGKAQIRQEEGMPAGFLALLPRTTHSLARPTHRLAKLAASEGCSAPLLAGGHVLCIWHTALQRGRTRGQGCGCHRPAG